MQKITNSKNQKKQQKQLKQPEEQKNNGQQQQIQNQKSQEISTIKIPKSIYEKNNEIFLTINAKPNSKIDAIIDINDDALEIAISAPAKDNEANEQLQAFLSQILGIKKTHLNLDKGSKSRSKLVAIQGTKFTLQQVYQTLVENSKNF